jgi:hypothetical protein
LFQSLHKIKWWSNPSSKKVYSKLPKLFTPANPIEINLSAKSEETFLKCYGCKKECSPQKRKIGILSGIGK